MKKTKYSDERREFLAVAAKFSAVTAVLGLSGNVWSDSTSAVSPEEESLKLLLKYAIDTGNMDVAIKKYGLKAKLGKEELSALRSLTSNELTVLKQIREKLAPYPRLRPAGIRE